MAGPDICTLHVYNRSAFPYAAFPLSRGVPFAPGALDDPAQVGVMGPDGGSLPAQTRVLQRRGDGSVEWALFEFLLDVEGDRHCDVTLVYHGERPLPAHPVTVARDGERLTLGNGLVSIALSSAPGPFIRALSVGGRAVVREDSRSEIFLTDPDGKIFRASLLGYTLEVEHEGPVRSTVRLAGKHLARDGAELLDFTLRFTLWADRADFVLAHTFCNRERPATGIQLAGLELFFDTAQDPAAEKVVHQLHHDRDFFSRKVAVRENAEIIATSCFDLHGYPAKAQPYQAGHVVLRNAGSLEKDYSLYPWHMLPGASSHRAELLPKPLQMVSSYAGWRSGDLTVIPRIRRMAALHPKSINLVENELTVGIWPRWAGPLTIRQGVSKTHEICFALADAALSDDEIEERSVRFELEWEPVEVGFDPAYPRSCRVLDQHQILEHDPIERPVLERMLAGIGNREDGPELYGMGTPGMLHYGDHGGPAFTNNEHDGHVWMPIIRYLRTGFTGQWEYAREHAWHYMEVDWCAFSTDPLQHGALIPHCQNHHEGPAYPSHQWIEGLIAYYYLSGDERVPVVARALGDHLLTVIERAPQMITADGREAGLPLANLAAIYKLTGERKFIDGAYWIIDNFLRKYMQPDGRLRYPHQGNRDFMMTNYADFSSMSGLWRVYEVTGDESLRPLMIALNNAHAVIENMNPNDYRSMDFDAPWFYYQLTGDESIFTRMGPRTESLLRQGGNKKNNLRWLKLLADTGRLPGDAP